MSNAEVHSSVVWGAEAPCTSRVPEPACDASSVVKERPILFSGAMVRALLGGRKTQTRRVVKGVRMFDAEYDRQWHPHVLAPAGALPQEWSWWEGPSHGPSLYHRARCPYGKSGDRLRVRETWKPHSLYDGMTPRNMPESRVFYRADNGYAPSNTRWYPAIHMPRWASRITLEITDVRVERLNACNRDDARAEGLEWVAPTYGINGIAASWHADPVEAYRGLWEHINGPGSWDANPWVWVVEFKRVPATEEGSQAHVPAHGEVQAEGRNDRTQQVHP